MQTTPNSQYDPDSAPNEPYNCGPTTVTNALKFHLDKDFGIEATRNLATARNGTGTNISERKIMFDKRGVPASPQHFSYAEVKKALNGKKAFDIALLMSKIPLAIRRRPFPGAHSVEAIGVGYANCPVHGRSEPGIWVNNPDFHPERGEKSRYFYPDHAWQPAYSALGGWCVVPNKDKVIATRVPWKHKCKTKAALRARSGPGTTYSTVKTLPKGYVLTTVSLEKNGGAYVYAGMTRRDWASFVLNGRVVWVARAYLTLL